MKPPADLKARVLLAVARDPSPDRRAVSVRAARAWLGVGLATALMFVAIGGLRAVERPLAFVLGTAAGWGGIALAATVASARRGKMVGRPFVVLVLSVAVTPVALGLWYLIWVGNWGGLGPPAPASRALVCFGVSLVLAAGPFFVLTRGRRDTFPAHPRATAAAIGVVAGAWAGVLMDLHCERADVVHVALGHVAPAAVLALAGAVLGDRLLGTSPEPDAPRGR
jgi:hypothetical protein